MKFALMFIITALLILTGCNTVKPVACTEEVKICPDGTAVGRTGPNCEFSPCPPSNNTEKNICTPDSRSNDCTAEFHPVCGWFNSSILCIRYPCAINAGNPCTACSNENVEYWTEGQCPE